MKTTGTTTIGNRSIYQFLQALNDALTRGWTEFQHFGKTFALVYAYGDRWQLLGPDGPAGWVEKDERGSYALA